MIMRQLCSNNEVGVLKATNITVLLLLSKIKMAKNVTRYPVDTSKLYPLKISKLAKPGSNSPHLSSQLTQIKCSE